MNVVNIMIEISICLFITDFEKTFQNFSVDWSKSVELLQNQIEYLKNETVTNRPTELPVNIEDNNGIFQVKIVNKTRKQNVTAELDEYWDPEITLNIVNKTGTRDENYDENVDWEDTPNVSNLSSIIQDDAERNITDSVENVDFDPAITPVVVDRKRIAENITDDSVEHVDFEQAVTPEIVDRTRIGGNFDHL